MKVDIPAGYIVQFLSNERVVTTNFGPDWYDSDCNIGPSKPLYPFWLIPQHYSCGPDLIAMLVEACDER